MSELMISVSGVRGVFGKGLTPEIALNMAAHFGIFCNKGTIVVGRDSRTTGTAMLHAIVSGLISVGCDVIDIGIAATPTTLLMVEQSQASGGISITASHNPAEWNAMKLVDSNGLFLFPERSEAFIRFLQEPIEYAPWDKMGKVITKNNASTEHIQKILAIPYLPLEEIRKRHFKVVLDSVNGAGGVISPILLKELGCEVISINEEPTGHFAHTPEPLNQNLTQLEKAVQEHMADIGFATDPDVDRLAVVSEKGYCIGEEFTLLLCERFVLSKKKGDIVTNLSSSMASEDIAREYGVQVHRTRVGEINVGKKMKEIQSPIGGEGNGGCICPDVHYTRDAPVGMALLLAYMAEQGKLISELTESIPHYFFSKDKIITDKSKLDPIMKQAEIVFKNENIDRTDGLKIIGDKHWIHIRKSGTEPIIRVYVEAETQEKANSICINTITAITQV